jgi:hypothetical protein
MGIPVPPILFLYPAERLLAAPALAVGLLLVFAGYCNLAVFAIWSFESEAIVIWKLLGFVTMKRSLVVSSPWAI